MRLRIWTVFFDDRAERPYTPPRADVNIFLSRSQLRAAPLEDMKLIPCHLCIAKPSGIEGHMALVRRQLEDLPTEPMSPPTLFRCVKCSTSWSRSYVGDGVFLWHPYVFVAEGMAPSPTAGD